MKNKVSKLLKNKFHHSSFRLGQKEAIFSILEGNDTLLMLPTGVGKSLCYQLPAYLLEGTVLVVSPLLSLMQDQVENLKLSGEKKVVALNSETSFFERERIFNQMQNYRFIYSSPEMLQNPRFIQALKSIKISMFVVDEAHCISHWGTDFRPDYLALKNVRKELGSPRTMALTATATQEVRQEIIQFLGLDKKETNKIVKSVDRPEIKFVVEHCQRNKNQKLEAYLNKLNGPGIIYFMSKKLADKWSDKLNTELGISAASYHSDIQADDKTKIQKQFLQNELEIICATSAFGMGFDKEDIHFVIHYHLPASIEMYLQEVGRASRDGRLSLAILLYQPGDEQIQWRFIKNSLPNNQLIKKIYLKKKIKREIDKNMIKLAEYYIDSSNSLEKVYYLVDERKKMKEKQLYSMLEYIHEEDCKRTQLLQYFGEPKELNLKKCCSSCGLGKKKIIGKINKQKKSVKEDKKISEMKDWEVILKSLYNKS